MVLFSVWSGCLVNLVRVVRAAEPDGRL